jgi:uncharacterized protein (DUF362 family)
MHADGVSQVFVIKTGDRSAGVRELMDRFMVGQMSGKRVAIKANYNSADPFPASTHLDTLSSIVDSFQDSGASIVLAERSGMGITRDVLFEMGVTSLAQKKGFDVVVLDSLKGDDWYTESSPDSHWKRGFLFPKLFMEANAIVETCCLKTHRFGGHFTMSLKNSVGMVAKHDPGDRYNYMFELHGSPYQRLMIAEINAVYRPLFVIMDAIKGFSTGGPEAGKLIEPGLLLASSDRVALDAAGVAILRSFGTTHEVSSGPIFKQEQIARAAELGLGAKGSDDMEIVPVNDEAKEICSRISEELRTAGPGFKEYRIMGT